MLSHLLCCSGTCYLHFSAKKQFAEHMLFLAATLPQPCSPGWVCVSHPGACQPTAEEALAPLHFASPCPRAELGRQLLRLCRCPSLPPPSFPHAWSVCPPSLMWDSCGRAAPGPLPLQHCSQDAGPQAILDAAALTYNLVFGLLSQQCGLVVRPLKSQAAPTSPCRCTLPSLENSAGAEAAH